MMRPFIAKLSTYIIFLTIVLAGCIILYSALYKLPKPTKQLVFIGDSTAKSSVNTHIADKYENYSQGGEAYLFTYFKLKKLVEINKVDTVLINFSPLNILNNDTENYSAEGRSRYLPFIDINGHADLYKGNPKLYLASWIDMSKNLVYLFRSRTISLGGYTPNYKKYEENYFIPQDGNIISSYQKKYLDKIVKLCVDKKITLVFVDLPKYQYDRHYASYGRKAFYDFYQSNYPQIDFLNFSRMPLVNAYDKSNFADMIHTSDKGAVVFSQFLKNNELSYLLNSTFNIKKQTINRLSNNHP